MLRFKGKYDEGGPSCSDSISSSPTLADSIQLPSLSDNPPPYELPLSGARSSSRVPGLDVVDTGPYERDEPAYRSTGSSKKPERRCWRKLRSHQHDDVMLPQPLPTAQSREVEADEYHLALTGYSQVFLRTLSPIDSFFAMIATASLATSLPAILFLISIYAGGPKAALINWIVVGLMSIVLTLCLGEIAATMPTSAGLYSFSYRLGGEENGPFLAWITAWLSWIGWLTVVPAAAQVSSNFLLSMLKMHFMHDAFVDRPWFHWALIVVTLVVFVLLPNITSPHAMLWALRACMATSLGLVAMYVIWLPAAATHRATFHPDLVLIFNNRINSDTMIYGSDTYVWLVAAICPAWIFKGFEVSIHLSEETKQASRSVATGMWAGVLVTYLVGIPVLVLMVSCIKDMRHLLNATHLRPYVFAEYLAQAVGHHAAMAILVLAWIDAALATSVLFMSAQRLTYALAHDGVFPYRDWITRISKQKLPVNAGFIVFTYSAVLSMVGASGTSSFQALLAIAVVAQYLSYAVVLSTRVTYGRKKFRSGNWNLRNASIPLNVVSLLYTGYLFVVLILPVWFPIEASTFNFSSVGLIIILVLALGTWIMPRYGMRKQWKGPRAASHEYQLHDIRLASTPPMLSPKL